MKKLLLGQFEELVLLAILKLGSGAYGVTVRQTLQEALERTVSIGAVYATVDRLERKGLISSWLGEATVERGGRAKRFFRVESAGIQALKHTEFARQIMIQGLEPDWSSK